MKSNKMPWKNGRYVPRLRPEPAKVERQTRRIQVESRLNINEINDSSFTETFIQRIFAAESFSASFLRSVIPDAVFSVKSGLRSLFSPGFVSSEMIADNSITGSKITNAIKASLINGGSAGNHTVSGIKPIDELICVFEQNGTSGLLTDLTSEFSIKKADTISNTGGTATSGDKLLVFYLSK
jgi:hypothetical protein|tara:strand:+ start:519 stop:1064 length:546 start_codon:yes stop_codon:yes gene_type:complete